VGPANRLTILILPSSFTVDLAKIPVDASSHFRIGIIPIYGSLIAGIHAGTTFYAILNLKMYFAILIHGITVGGTNISGTLMWAYGVTDIGINPDMGLDLRFCLVAITD